VSGEAARVATDSCPSSPLQLQPFQQVAAATA